MARANAFLRINDPAVKSFMMPGQPVDEEIWKVSRDTGNIARTVTAPSRTGRLRKSIQANRPHMTGPYQNQALVFVKIGYGVYVHEGTAGNGSGYILPANGAYLTIPRNHRDAVLSGGTLRKAWRSGGRKSFPDGKPYFTAERVRGQKSNPFLAEALHIAMPRG